MSRNIVIFGGSFDPIHLGHISLIKSSFSSIRDIDVFYIMPRPDFPKEGRSYFFNFFERSLMVKVCLGILDKRDLAFLLSKECKVPEPIYTNNLIVFSALEETMRLLYTYQTIEFYKSKNPEDTIHIILGADQAEQFSTWMQFEKIASQVKLWFVPRHGFLPDPQFSWNRIEMEESDISSTEIREISLLRGEDASKTPEIISNLMKLFILDKSLN